MSTNISRLTAAIRVSAEDGKRRSLRWESMFNLKFQFSIVSSAMFIL